MDHLIFLNCTVSRSLQNSHHDINCYKEHLEDISQKKRLLEEGNGEMIIFYYAQNVCAYAQNFQKQNFIRKKAYIRIKILALSSHFLVLFVKKQWVSSKRKEQKDARKQVPVEEGKRLWYSIFYKLFLLYYVSFKYFIV